MHRSRYYIHTYIYLYTRWMYYLSCVKPNLYTASTCNKCVSNQPKKKNKNRNKCENYLEHDRFSIVTFSTWQFKLRAIAHMLTFLLVT